MVDVSREVADISEQLDRLRPLMEERRWAELEAVAREVCALLAGPEVAEVIASVDTSAYERDLHQLALEAARICPPGTPAVYFEFDPDDGWESTFFVCGSYQRAEVREEEWACDWVHHLSGPAFEPFAVLYDALAGYGHDGSAVGTALFLIARTVATYGRALTGVDFGPRAVCIAFHDQADILRVRELY